MHDTVKADKTMPLSDHVPQLAAPTTIEDTGLGLDLLMQLTLKMLFASGELMGVELARRQGLLFRPIEPAVELLRAQRYCEIVSGTMLGAGSYVYRITSAGRSAAAAFMAQNRYTGIAPVPLALYRRYMSSVARASGTRVTRATVQQAFGHLVLGDTVLDEIGPAARSGRSIFIYGPPGNGKTSIAAAIRDLMIGDVAIPHALEVEGAIIRIFDPVNHQIRPVATGATSADVATVDRRWAFCQRPIVRAGGELTLDALDLVFDGRAGYYRAPLQLVANGGVLVIDDFGRQRCSPHDLLNRWMVPLESGVDYLSLQSGLKFEVPFLPFVAFATNLRPSQLVDEAFLRRVPHKVFARNPSRQAFVDIFERACRDVHVPFDAAMPAHLLDGFYQLRSIEPRACHPRDLVNHAVRLAEYRGEPRLLTRDLVDAACANYFVDDHE